MRNKLLKVIAGIGLMSLQTTLFASDLSFYSDHSKGWFFKEKLPEVEIPSIPTCINDIGSIFWDTAGITHSFIKLHPNGLVSRDQFGQLSLLPYRAVNCEPPKIASAPKTAEKRQTEEKKKIESKTSQMPAPLSAKWFREKLDDYKDAAIDDPSNTQKVRAYLYLQRVMMDKAEQFTSTYQQVVMGDPFLDETNRLPVASYGVKEFEKQAKENQETILKKLGNEAGLFFFYDQNCHACEKQGFVLSLFERYFEFDVVPVSVDGSKLSGGYLAGQLLDKGQSKVMGVQALPAIVLASPTKGTFRSIGQGSILALDELKDRVMLAAKSISLITPEEYDTAIPSNGSHRLIQVRSEKLTDEIMQDPYKLVEHIRGMGKVND